MEHKITPLIPVRRPCLARTRAGTPYRNWSMKNKTRCRLHGGKSTGPRTPEGLERSRKVNWKHGKFSEEAIAERRRVAAERRRISRILDPILRGKGIPSSRSIDNLLTLLENGGMEKMKIGQLGRLSRRLFEINMAFEKKIRERNEAIKGS